MQDEKYLEGLCNNFRCQLFQRMTHQSYLFIITISIFSLTKTLKDKAYFCYGFIGGTIQH